MSSGKNDNLHQVTGKSIKTKLNKTIKEVRVMLNNEKEQAIEHYLRGLSATEATDYSLWKATKKLKRPRVPNPSICMENGARAKSNADKTEFFAKHLEKVFTPNPEINPYEDEEEILQYLDTKRQHEAKINKFTIKEVKKVILMDGTLRKAQDLITGKILKELPDVGFKFLTQLYNCLKKQLLSPTVRKLRKSY